MHKKFLFKSGPNLNQKILSSHEIFGFKALYLPHSPSSLSMQALESQLHEFSLESRRSIRYAAKLATTSIIKIRFGESTLLNNRADSSSNTITAEDVSIIETLDYVKRESLDWLVPIEHHFEITSLSSTGSSQIDTAFLGKTSSSQHFDIAHELLLVSLGLTNTPSEISSPIKSSKSKSLDYSALVRNLILLTLKSLNIEAVTLESVEKSLAQTLHFQLQQLSSSSSSTSSLPSTISSTSSTSHPPTSSSSKTFKYLTTGAGVLLGGVALGITGGLAAPALIPLLGGLGITSFSGASGAVLLGTLFGVGGGK